MASAVLGPARASRPATAQAYVVSLHMTPSVVRAPSAIARANALTPIRTARRAVAVRPGPSPSLTKAQAAPPALPARLEPAAPLALPARTEPAALLALLARTVPAAPSRVRAAWGEAAVPVARAAAPPTPRAVAAEMDQGLEVSRAAAAVVLTPRQALATQALVAPPSVVRFLPRAEPVAPSAQDPAGHRAVAMPARAAQTGAATAGTPVWR